MQKLRRIVFTFYFSFLILFNQNTIKASDQLEKRNYDVSQIETQTSDGTFAASIYKPRNESIKAILIITPTIIGISEIELSNAVYFSKYGYLVMLTHPFAIEMRRANPDIAKMDNDFFKPLKSVESFLKIVEDRFNLPKDLPIVAMGASQGAIITLALAAHFPRIVASWTAVGGGDLPSIYANSMQPDMVLFRSTHMAQLGLAKKSDYENYLRAHMTNDPLTVCQDIKNPMIQIIAERDTFVPTYNQELIAKKCPQHIVRRHKVIHSSGVLMSVTKRKEVLEFFNKMILKKSVF